MRLFLGVDGGQSATKALIGDASGRVLGAGKGGPCNHATAAEGRARLERGVTVSVGAACAEAGIDAKSASFEAACFGMSGGPEDKVGILTSLLRAGRLTVTTDAVIALSGAIAGGSGVITIGGTGSIAFGRNASGRSARAGGWGYIFGDEGSAFDIARQAMRAALRMEEGWGPPTSLLAALLDATGAPDANSALHLFYAPDWPRSRVATLAPLVDSAAMDGDTVAGAILNGAAQEHATIVAGVRSQLWRSGDAVTVAYIGGVFQSKWLLERFRNLVELTEQSHVQAPLYGPAEGALLEAYRSVGLQIDLAY